MVFAAAHGIHLGSSYSCNLIVNGRQIQQSLHLSLRHIGRHNHAGHYAVVADFASDGAGINADQGGQVLLLQPSFQALFIAPIAGTIAQLTDYIALEKVFTTLIKHGIGAIIAHQRIGHHNNLTTEGGVGQGLLIAAHAGSEANLTHCIAFAAIEQALINAAILQN